MQHIAHDTILRKLAADPEWFLNLLDGAKDSLSPASCTKYREAGTALFEQDHDQYLKSAVMAKYARYQQNPEYTGNAALSLDAIVDMIHYYANSTKVILHMSSKPLEDTSTSLPKDAPMFLYWFRVTRSRQRAGILKKIGYMVGSAGIKENWNDAG